MAKEPKNQPPAAPDAVDLGVGVDAHAAALTPKTKIGRSEDDGFVATFYSYQPDLRVLQTTEDGIDADSIHFDGGLFRANAEDKEFLLNHRFYELERYDLVEDTIVVGGKVQSTRKMNGRIQSALTDGKTVFMFDENPSLKLIIPTKDGLTEIRFDDGFCSLDKEQADVIRSHQFYTEGRFKEVTANGS